jgi:hypothetical protein
LYSSIENIRSGWAGLASLGLLVPMFFFLCWEHRLARRVKPTDLKPTTIRHA